MQFQRHPVCLILPSLRRVQLHSLPNCLLLCNLLMLFLRRVFRLRLIWVCLFLIFLISKQCRDSLKSVCFHPSGARVYLVFAKVLHLANLLTVHRRVEIEEIEKNGNRGVGHDTYSNTISDTLGEMQNYTQQLVGLLQSVPTPSIRAR